jgi:hypothetical protein
MLGYSWKDLLLVVEEQDRSFCADELPDDAPTKAQHQLAAIIRTVDHFGTTVVVLAVISCCVRHPPPGIHHPGTQATEGICAK